MDKISQKKINKANRKRGSAFEKWGADFLDMDVVPYSGSNARFGYGDVRDSIWLGEFKNITPDEHGQIKIEHKWFDKNYERAKDINHGCHEVELINMLYWMLLHLLGLDRLILCGLNYPRRYIILRTY